MHAGALALSLLFAVNDAGPYVNVYHDDAVALQVRRDRIKITGDRQYQVWLRWLWAEPQRWKSDFETATVRVVDLDCNALRVRELAVLHKNAKAEIFDAEEFEPESAPWKAMPHESGAGAAIARVCEFLPQLVQPDAPWLRADERHVRVYGNAPAERMARITVDLHHFLGLLEDVLGEPSVAHPEPCNTVIVYRDRASLDALLRRAFPGSRPIPGFVVPTPRTTYLVADADGALYRDLIRSYIRTHFPSTPAWLETGLMETLGSFQQDGRSALAALPRREHIQWLLENRSADVAQVLANPSQRNAFEAMSWAMTQLLLFEPPKRQFSETLAIDKDPRGWINARTMTVTPLKKRLERYATTPQPAGRAEVLVQLGNVVMHAGGGNRDAAIAFYRDALVDDPNNAHAHAMLGVALDETKHLDAATRAGVDDPGPYLVYAQLLLEHTGAVRFEAPEPPPADVLRARELLKTALAKDATLAAAWASLARTWVFDQSGFDEGIQAAERALSLDARSDAAALSLVLLHLKKNDAGRAAETFDKVLRPIAQPSTLQAAERGMSAWKLHRADALARGGDLAAAKRIISEVLSITTDAELRKKLEDDLAKIELTEETLRLTEIYNRAVRAINDGKPNVARPLIEQILREARDPALRRDAQELREKIGAPASRPRASSGASPIRSIDPADDDFRDLEPLRAALRGVRVVLLGESSHGDGSTFLAKTRLIRFLHETMGFDVLAFESGIYDCAKAWEFLARGEPAHAAVSRGVFRIWTASREVQPLIDYLGRRAKSQRPLELAGVDCQLTGSASAEFLASDLAAFLSGIDPKLAAGEDWDRVVRFIARLADSTWELRKEPMPPAREQAEFTRTIERWQSRIPAGAFWRQVLESIRVYAEQTWRIDPNEPSRDAAVFAMRDRQMGKNLIWLANERHPNRKIIVWAATFHNARNLGTIDTGSEKYSRLYRATSPMGEVAFSALGEELYSLGFTSFDGETATAFARKAQTLPPPGPASLEQVLAQTNANFAFVDFRNPPSWARKRISGRLLGHTEMRADWTRIVDGVVFIRTMTRSTRTPP